MNQRRIQFRGAGMIRGLLLGVLCLAGCGKAGLVKPVRQAIGEVAAAHTRLFIEGRGTVDMMQLLHVIRKQADAISVQSEEERLVFWLTLTFTLDLDLGGGYSWECCEWIARDVGEKYVQYLERWLSQNLGEDLSGIAMLALDKGRLPEQINRAKSMLALVKNLMRSPTGGEYKWPPPSVKKQ